MSFLKKIGPLLFTVGLTVASVLSPAASAAVGSHPYVAASLVIATQLLHALLPSVFGSDSSTPAVK